MRILDRVLPGDISSPPAVLKIITGVRFHVPILDVPEINPDMREVVDKSGAAKRKGAPQRKTYGYRRRLYLVTCRLYSLK